MLKKPIFFGLLIIFVITLSAQNPLFEVRNDDGISIFKVTSTSVKIFGMNFIAEGDNLWISDSAETNLLLLNGTGMVLNNASGQQVMNVNGDSLRFYLNALTDESRGGFAISSVGARDGSNFLNLTPDNYFIGYRAGSSTTTGINNTFIGYNCGADNEEGSNNVFLGYESGQDSFAGLQNVFLGYMCGRDNVGAGNDLGDYNVFIGNKCGKDNVDGQSNVFIGKDCGVGNRDGTYNVFLGSDTAKECRDGNYNVYLGSLSGENNKDGSYNTFLGYNVANRDTTTYNTFIGFESANDHRYGMNNVFLGSNSGYQNINGAQNTFIGSDAGESNVNGSANVFLGNEAGLNETGSDKLYIENTDNTASDALIYGDFAMDELRYNANIGINTAPSFSYGAKINGGSEYALYLSGSGFATGGYIDGSDECWKDNIQDLDNALDIILSLRGVSFNWNSTAYPEYEFEQTPQVGFLAQEVNEILPEIVKEDGNGNMGIDYSKLTPVLLEAIKQQQIQIEELQKHAEILMNKIVNNHK
ncbi:tail fiber domain-containing protein [Candidatus Cloacimonadota bacterium]